MKESNKILFHYTSLEGLLGIIESKSIWATNILYLNGASELNYAIEIFREKNIKIQRHEIRNAFSHKHIFFENQMKFIDKMNLSDDNRNYVCSFSEEGDILSQWRGYCPNTIGFSIGFNFSELSKCGTLKACIYDAQKQKSMVNSIIENVSSIYDKQPDHGSHGKYIFFAGANLYTEFMRLVTFFKHPKFREEKGWRLVKRGSHHDKPKKFRTGQSTIVPFIEIDLPKKEERLLINKIIVGPTKEPILSKASVKMLLRSKKVIFDEVLYSTIPYRNW